MANAQQTERLYAERASFYDKLFIDLLGWGRELETFFRKSNYLAPRVKILDAGCGTGIVTRTLYQIGQEKGYAEIVFHAFDLTPNMLEILRQWIIRTGAKNIQVEQANVLDLDNLPSDWNEYDLIVSATMLEYLPKDRVKDALTNLRKLLGPGGILLLFITRRNLLTRWLARAWWKTNIYQDREIQTLLDEAGFDQVQFKRLDPGWASSIMVVEATEARQIS